MIKIEVVDTETVQKTKMAVHSNLSQTFYVACLLMIVKLMSGTTINCHEANSCEGESMLLTVDGDIQCFGTNACRSVGTITSNGTASIHCSGSEACQNVLELFLECRTNDEQFLYCHGLGSCKKSNIIIRVISGKLQCYGADSCAKSTVYMQRGSAVNLDGARSGLGANITSQM